MSDPMSAGLSIFGMIMKGNEGLMARDAAKFEASQQETQAHVARDEALAEADRKATEVRKFRADQTVAFLKSGVTLEGSPLLVSQETIREGNKEVKAIRTRGASQFNLLMGEAAKTRNQGRNALFKSIISAGTQGISALGGSGG